MCIIDFSIYADVLQIHFVVKESIFNVRLVGHPHSDKIGAYQVHKKTISF